MIIIGFGSNSQKIFYGSAIVLLKRKGIENIRRVKHHYLEFNISNSEILDVIIVIMPHEGSVFLIEILKKVCLRNFFEKI
ncbi:hypothetical protein ASG99_18440 [Bacillus sp. Soil768D1]|nr:hypothetical protein ASG99_18440 [Bacillus sp. Soil768D1]